MAFLKSIRPGESAGLPADYPFSLPIVESLDVLSLDQPVTFFVGENGSGKSTLLEAIACGLKCPSLGAADTTRDPMLAEARALARHLIFSRSARPRVKLFFRAEDAIGFTRRVNTETADLRSMESHYEKTLSGYARTLATGVVRGQRDAMTSRYGENPDARSHGQWFLSILKTRIRDHGIYLLDEPETPLSPIYQLSLLSLIKEMTTRNCQFIIATHSPILMALPGATLYAFDSSIRPIAWDETEHVAITRAFLNDPESYLRHL